jgi:hypothetical protein
MFTLRCPTCIAVLPKPEAARCPVCRENLRTHRPIVIGDDRLADWWRRLPWERHTMDDIDEYFATRPLPGKRRSALDVLGIALDEGRRTRPPREPIPPTAA